MINMTILTQIALPVATHAASPDMSLLDLIFKGGYVMVPIFLLSVLGVYIFVEKFFYIRKLGKVDRKYILDLMGNVEREKIESAIQLSQHNGTSIGRIFATGLGHLGKPIREIEDSIESAANIEVARMEKNISYLGIIAGIAPMLGFVGTISGVIKIFYSISLTDNISIGIIAGGLYQKMVCSGAGLIVGILAYSFYHYLQMMIDRFSLNLQDSVFEFINKIR
jgi:biopolymer transport protein ExbB